MSAPMGEYRMTYGGVEASKPYTVAGGDPEHPAENDAPMCHGPIPVEHKLGVLPDHCSACAEYDGPRRRNKTEARRCSQSGCPGDGRYQPPGRGHLPGCQHDPVTWVWETVIPPGSGEGGAS